MLPFGGDDRPEGVFHKFSSHRDHNHRDKLENSSLKVIAKVMILFEFLLRRCEDAKTTIENDAYLQNCDNLGRGVEKHLASALLWELLRHFLQAVQGDLGPYEDVASICTLPATGCHCTELSGQPQLLDSPSSGRKRITSLGEDEGGGERDAAEWLKLYTWSSIATSISCGSGMVGDNGVERGREQKERICKVSDKGQVDVTSSEKPTSTWDPRASIPIAHSSHQRVATLTTFYHHKTGRDKH